MLVGEVIETAGGVVSLLDPVTAREIEPPLAVKFTFPVYVPGAVGLKRTTTDRLAPVPTRLKDPPETTVNEEEAGGVAVPDTVPPPVFCTVNVLFAEPPIDTVPKFTVPVGVTLKSIRATPSASLEQALSLPLVSTAVTRAKYLVPV